MNKLARRLLLYLLFPMIGIGLIGSGCSKQDKVEPPDATLHLGIAGGPPQPLNPLLTDRSVSMELIKLVYNGLLKINGDMSYEPDLAQSWNISNDGLTYTFNLRKGVRFHDGAELTSADCAFTYALFKSYPAKAPRQSYFDSITGYQMPDKWTFRIILNKPFSLSITTMGIAILPEHCLSGKDAVGAVHEPPIEGAIRELPLLGTTSNPIGTGPFRFVEQTADNHIILERNPDYYEPVGAVHEPPIGGAIRELPLQGKPLSRIDAFGYDTQSQWLAGFMKGQTYVIYFLSGEQYEQVKRDPDVETHRSPYIWNYAVEYNLNHPLFKDKTVRQALAHGVNIPAIIQKIEGEAGITHPVPEGHPSQEGILPQVPSNKRGFRGVSDTSTGPFIPQTWWHNPAVKPLEYNPALAMQLLNSAGWQLNDKGILIRAIRELPLPKKVVGAVHEPPREDVEEFRFTLLVNPVVRQGKLMAMLLYQELFKLGIIVELQDLSAVPNTAQAGYDPAAVRAIHELPLPKEVVGAVHEPPKPGQAYLTVFCTMPDPAELEFDWRSQSTNRLYKLWPYANPIIDRLFDSGKRFSEIDQRRPIYQELQQRLYDDQPALFLYFFYNLGAVRKGFTGTEELFTPAMPFWTLKDWKAK